MTSMLFRSKKFTYLIYVSLALVLCLKFFGDFFVDLHHGNNTGIVVGDISCHKQFQKYMNPDDREMARTAKYYLLGHGFVTDVSFDRPGFRTDSLWKSALRPRHSIYLHVAGINLYGYFHPELDLSSIHDLPERYFYLYSLLICLAKNGLLLLSLFPFYAIARHFMSAQAAHMATLAYVTYPSLLLYVGILNLVECLITPLLVIVVYMLSKNVLLKKKLSLWETGALCIVIPLMIFLKTQTALIIGLVYLLILAYSIVVKGIFKLVWPAFVPLLLVFLSFIPVLVQNYRDFNKVLISTQAGLNLWYGHSDYARGSWTSRLFANHPELLPYLAAHKDILVQDEPVELDFYKQQAVAWVLENPEKELMLVIRKSAMYFLPHNYMSFKWNLYTLLVHICFLGSLFLFVRQKRYREVRFYFVLLPILASYLMNIVFFVEFRWRHFADPFLVLLACWFVSEWWLNISWGKRLQFPSSKE